MVRLKVTDGKPAADVTRPSVALFCKSTAAFLSPIASAVSSVSRLPTVAATTARIAIVIDTWVRNGSPRREACSACSACSKCSTGDSDMNQLLALETGFYRDAAMRAIKGQRKAKAPRVRQTRFSPSGNVRRFNGQRKPGNL